MRHSAFVALGLLILVANPAEILGQEREQDRIVVFRHHPGIIDTSENMRAKDEDEAAIFRALSENRIGTSYEGGLGSRGFTLTIAVEDLGRWKKIVDGLLRDGQLKYYRWGIDKFGFGIVPISPPPGPMS